MTDWTRLLRGHPTDLARDWRPRHSLSRRSILRGFARGAVVSVALPPLEAMFNTSGTAYACDGILPRRFGVWFWGNGMLPEHWAPSAVGWGDGQRVERAAQPLSEGEGVVSAHAWGALVLACDATRWGGCSHL